MMIPNPLTSDLAPLTWLLTATQDLFAEAELGRLLGNGVRGARDDGAARAAALIEADTPQLAREWLVCGGKRLRPFAALAGYRALASNGDLPDNVRRLAVAIEAFHKAALVHDDIEDNDATRYGFPTLHRRFDVGVAINVGDYLLGLGYRLVASVGAAAGPETGAAMVRLLSDAHVRLAQGQGAELAWRRIWPAPLSWPAVLKVYALKTAPGFEAALGCGLLLAGGARRHLDLARRFCRHVGIAFQVLNDLQGWEEDLRHRRPTILPLLAPGRTGVRSDDVERVGRDFADLGVFDAARDLIERFRARAHSLADAAKPETFADLLRLVADTILRGG